MSFLRPKVITPPPPPMPEPIAEPDYKRAAALSDEAVRRERTQRKGRASTIVGGGIMGDQTETGGTSSPTLLG